jgi:hypothetical protein
VHRELHIKEFAKPPRTHIDWGKLHCLCLLASYEALIANRLPVADNWSVDFSNMPKYFGIAMYHYNMQGNASQLQH